MQREGFEPACTKDVSRSTSEPLSYEHNEGAAPGVIIYLTCIKRKGRLWVNKEGSRWTCGTVIQCHTS